MALDFKSQAFEAYARIPSYSSWLLYGADLSTAYAYHRRVLRLLRWGPRHGRGGSRHRRTWWESRPWPTLFPTPGS